MHSKNKVKNKDNANRSNNDKRSLFQRTSLDRVIATSSNVLKGLLEILKKIAVT
jgi:hypothetical protein